MKTATPTPQKCTKCKHAWNRGWAVYCAVSSDVLTGEPLTCAEYRRDGFACGPDAHLFVNARGIDD